MKNKAENKSRVMAFRVPENIYERYERMCIEEHIFMSELLQDAVEREVKKREAAKKNIVSHPHQ